MRRTTTIMTALAVLMATFAMGVAVAAGDFGSTTETRLNAQARTLFGFNRPLAESWSENVGREPGQRAADLISLAGGLRARILTRDAANLADMYSFWPAEDPEYLIFCIEGGAEEIATGKLNPSVQRIDIATGAVETVLRGMDRCDGIRTTPWGTVLATEETDFGAAYEILDPTAITDVVITDRGGAGEPAVIEGDGADTVVKRTAMMAMAWEGLDVTAEGVVYGGDELRPGSNGPDTDGGAMFKFVPTNPWNGTAPIPTLGDSPLAEGSTWAFQASCNSGSQQWGQGCEVGKGTWVAVTAADATASADAAGATGYYRPEDGHFDPLYAGAGVRFCWTNTGSASAANYGEVNCLEDVAPMTTDGTQTATVNRFLEGDPELNQPDNLAFQPGTGNMYVIEDNDFGDVWACLRDGSDRDIKSDGCVRLLSVKDESAEPTGFEFSADGKTAYLSIQHSDDTNMDPLDDYGTDDIIVITGFRVP